MSFQFVKRETLILRLISIVCSLSLVVLIASSAPTSTSAIAPELSATVLEAANVEINKLSTSGQHASGSAVNHPSALIAATSEPVKLKRDSRAKVTSMELDTQETGYHPSAYEATDSNYGHDSGKNTYGKQESDWSLYDQGNHGLYDKYGDKAYHDHGHNAHSKQGKHDSYGNNYETQNSGRGSGYYSRDRGYGYEKHYAYDKEVAEKQHADNHSSYGRQHGLHDYYGDSGSHSHGHQGHDKYGQASRYGNHGYGKRGSNLAAHHDYGHNQNKAHYYATAAHPTHSYSSHVPTYRSSYPDSYHSSHSGYPSSYPSYY